MKTVLFALLLLAPTSFANAANYYTGNEGDAMVNLTVNDNGSASLIGGCTVVNIDRDFNTRGVPMNAVASGGPITMHWEQLTIVATQDRADDEIEMRFSDKRQTAKLKKVSKLPQNMSHCL